MPWRIKELRHYSYQQHALGYELLGLQVGCSKSV